MFSPEFFGMIGCFIATWAAMMGLWYRMGRIEQRLNDLNHSLSRGTKKEEVWKE